MKRREIAGILYSRHPDFYTGYHIYPFLFHFSENPEKRANQSVRLAADITTFFLFFSVTISIATLWGTRLSLIAIAISLLIAIIMTYQDWKTKKEMKIIPLLRKIWRVQFLYLVLVYNAVWLVGIVQSILFFIT